MRNVYVITMWTGDGPTRKWKSQEMPTLLPQGTGVEFVNAETRLKVQVIGNISIEEYESGKEEIESMRCDWVTLEPPQVSLGTLKPEVGPASRPGGQPAGKADTDNPSDEGNDGSKRDKGIRRLF